MHWGSRPKLHSCIQGAAVIVLSRPHTRRNSQAFEDRSIRAAKQALEDVVTQDCSAASAACSEDAKTLK